MEWIQEYGNIVGLAGLVFFFLFFVGVLVWVFRPGSKGKYLRYAKIPLKEDK